MKRYASKCVAVLGAATLALALASCEKPSDEAATESSGFVGTYKTQDTQGNPMTITLDEEGSATGSRAGEDLTGSWKDDGGSAMITWSDNWTTKISKDGDSYSKTAYKDGAEDGGTVAAEKTE